LYAAAGETTGYLLTLPGDENTVAVFLVAINLVYNEANITYAASH